VRNAAVVERIQMAGLAIDDVFELPARVDPTALCRISAAETHAHIEAAGFQSRRALELLHCLLHAALMKERKAEPHVHRRRRVRKGGGFSQRLCGPPIVAAHEMSKPEMFQRRAMIWLRSDCALQKWHCIIYALVHQARQTQ
jgi:hypothetical protein